MPGIVANADKYVSSYPFSDAHERMWASLASVTGITSCTWKLVDNVRTEIERNWILNTKHTTNLKRRKS